MRGVQGGSGNERSEAGADPLARRRSAAGRSFEEEKRGGPGG